MILYSRPLNIYRDRLWQTITDSMNKTPDEAAALEAQLIKDAALAAPSETEEETELS